jgi:hypothetical protein
MSLLRGTWNNGQSITVPELNRPLDVSANADDRVYESLFTPGATQKRLIPLDLTTTDHTKMVVPGSTSGSVALKPCTLVAGDPSVTTAIKMSATLLASLDSTLIGSNSSGLTRIDLLYATIARSTPASIGSPGTGVAYAGIGVADPGTGAQQSRTVKDTTSGTVTTQTINIYDVPTITLTVLAGTPGSGAPSLPADGASAYNFALAQITVANGFTSGSAISAGNIAQEWTQARIPHFLVRGLEDGTRSVSALVIDGTGGQTVTPPAGVLQVSGLGMTGTTLPTPTPTLGSLYKDQCIFACITFQHSGSAFAYENFYNIQSAVRNSAGNYTFTTILSASQTPLLVQVASSTAGFITVNWTSATTFVVTTSNTSNTPTDYNNSVHVTILGH